MSLHQLHANKNNINFSITQKKSSIPTTCDTIIKNLINNPKHHLALINKKNTANLFPNPTHKTRKIRKMNNQFTNTFSVNIQQVAQEWEPSQLIDFLSKIDQQDSIVNGSYTMQPIIVEKNTEDSSSWILLTGQQRITSIYMILKYLESNFIRIDTCSNCADLLNKHFLKTISYKAWDNFLENTQTKNSFLNDSFTKTYLILHNWFSNKTAVEQKLWKRKLLNHTKFIWYAAEEESYAGEIALDTETIDSKARYLS